MDKKSLFIPVVTLLLFADCRKVFQRDSGNSGSSGNPSAKQNPTSYELSSETFSYPPTGQGGVLSFTYNNQNLVSGISISQWITAPPSNPAATATTFQMQYDNGFISTITDNLGDLDTLTYNSNGQLIQEKGGPTNVADRTLSYDDRGNLVRLVEDYVNLKSIYSHTFSYDNLNDLVSEVDSQESGTSLVIQETQCSGYDSKVDFSLAVNGLPPSLFYILQNSAGGAIGQSSAILSPHNAGTVTYYAIYADPALSNGPDPVTNTYQYNEQGLPVMIQSGGWAVTLQYQRY
jgi:hypothetical protein